MAERSGTVTVIRAVRKLRLSRPAAGRDDPVTVSWQQTALATLDGSLALVARALRRCSRASSRRGPQALTLDAARLAALPDGNYTFALRARTAVGEQVLRASFQLDRGPPLARFVRLRVRGRSAFLVVRLSEADDRARVAGARVVVPRRPRAAGLNGFRFRLPAGVPPRLACSSSTARAIGGRAGRCRARQLAGEAS